VSTPEITPNNFDRSKPFYPLAVAYICLLFGYKELAGHGAARMLHAILEDEDEGALEEWRKANDASDELRDTMERMARATELELMPPLELASKVQGKIKIDAEIVAEDLAQNALYLGAFTMRTAGSLLIVAYESTAAYRDKGPLWEFLRHCRNAAAHNGRFHVVGDEPRRRAKWESFNVTKSLHGTALFHSQMDPGLIGPGDAIRLAYSACPGCPSSSRTPPAPAATSRR